MAFRPVVCGLLTLPFLFTAPSAERARLVCPASVILFSESGSLAWDIPDSVMNFWSAVAERDAAGVARRTGTEVGQTGGQRPRAGWGRGKTTVEPRSGVASWRMFVGYTREEAEVCVVSTTVAADQQALGSHAVTVPHLASIERIQISTVDEETGSERICATWERGHAVPESTTCGMGPGQVSFAVQKYTEPANPPIQERDRVAPIFLEAAQGFRFGCSGPHAPPFGCRIEVTWKPPQ